MSNNMSEERKKLYEALLKLETIEECELFLQDLCTYNELDSMSQRLQAAKLLLSGETYEQVIAKTGISSTTLSRVSKCIRHGDGGYKKIIEK